MKKRTVLSESEVRVLRTVFDMAVRQYNTYVADLTKAANAGGNPMMSPDALRNVASVHLTNSEATRALACRIVNADFVVLETEEG